MALMLFRSGVYILLAVLATWVLRDNLLADYTHVLNDHLLNQVGLAGLALLGLGIIALIYEKASAGPRKTKCKICRRPVIAGEYYCREHLREIVDRVRQS